jgi:hypothetical protein
VTIPSIAQFLTDPDFLGEDFAGPSWAAWRVTLKATFGEPMYRGERHWFRALAGRDPPARRVREAWFAIGRRGGKDSIVSGIATYMAVFGGFARHLRRGEKATILCLAVDRVQSGIVFGYIKSYFEQVPSLRPLVRHISDSSIELKNGIEILVATNNFRSIRGRTVALAILDECAYWRSDEYANPDAEVYAALLPALATLRASGAMIVGISTVYRRAGLLFNKWLRHHGRDDPNVLVIRQPSAVYNPTLDEPELAREIAEDIAADPERGAAEWLGEWRTDLADFVDRQIVEALVVPGRFELPRQPGVQYHAVTDPSGGSSDSMTLAIGHTAPDGTGVLDALREVRPPFSPEAVVQEFAQTLRSYGVTVVWGDRYAGQWPVERFLLAGISYEPLEKTKSQIYVDLLPLLNSGRVELLDHPRLVAQLCQLERRTARGGKDSIDHLPGAHDDIANAAAGVLVAVAGEAAQPALWRPSTFGDPVDPSDRTYLIFAVIASDDEGQLASVFFAKTAERYWSTGAPPVPPLLVLDVEVATLADLAHWPKHLNAQLNDYLDAAPGPRPAVAIFAPEELLRHGHGWDPLPPALASSTLALPEMALRAAVHLAQGQVRLSPQAAERRLRHPYSALSAWRTGDVSSPVAAAFITGVLLALADPADLTPRAAA